MSLHLARTSAPLRRALALVTLSVVAAAPLRAQQPTVDRETYQRGHKMLETLVKDIKAYYYDNYRPNPSVNAPGKGLAEEVTVTLAKPLEGSGKKKPERAARPASKSRVSK